MKNSKSENLIELIRIKLHKYNVNAILMSITNDHLYEYVEDKDNYVKDVSGFTGDTAYVLIKNKKNYLIIDGRFIVQAKKEINKKLFEIVVIDSRYSLENFIFDVMNEKETLLIDSKKISAKKAIMYENVLAEKNIKIKFIDDVLKNIFKYKDDNIDTAKRELFILPKESQVKNSKQKLELIKNEIKKNQFKNYVYITSNIEEIAYITNLRLKPISNIDTKILFDSFLILSEKEVFIFIKDYIKKNILNILHQNNIMVLPYELFYKIIKNFKTNKKILLSNDGKKILNLLKKSNVLIDEKINNYFIVSKFIEKAYLVDSPIEKIKSIRTKNELGALKLCNIIDSVSVTKAIYKIKNIDYKNNIYTEYDIKQIVDAERTKSNKFLCNSFDTIVAYKGNSAICHYAPKKNKSKIISNDSILLIDSGGHYTIGTTDVTRTISLYKKNAPKKLKKHYTLVLKSLLGVMSQRFKEGTNANYIDILGRRILYNKNLDFSHGLGHGIGYISNVHEGPNNFSRFNSNNNELVIGEVSSLEPGLYFESKYGIRLENDIVVAKDKNDFLKFENLTFCPFDISLIDINILENNEIKQINEYHKLCYKLLSKYMNKEELKWLKQATNKI